MSLRARFVLICAVFLALAGAAAALGSVLILRANDARRDHTEMASAAQLVQDFESTYVGEAASIRAYFLSGDETSLEDYESRRVDVINVNGRLRDLLTDKPALLRSVTAVTDAARQWHNEAILPLITLQQARGQSPEVVTAYRDGPAVVRFQKIIESLDVLRSRVVAVREAAAGYESRTRAHVARWAVGSVAAALVVVVALHLIARLWISRPLNQLARALQEPSDVALRRRGSTEIKRLTHSIDTLRERARSEIESTARTREGLAQNAALLMSIRAQLETSPENLPDDWTVAAQLVPAMGIVAGDCYNVDVLAREYLTIVVVDVAGHGAGSAVVALRANELLRAGVRSYEDPRDAVLWASALLSDLDPGMFVTAFVGKLHFETGLLRYVNAGHPAALICDGVNSADLVPTGPLIGPFPGRWKSREAVIGPGQMLVCYTDGLIEGRDEQRAEFGIDRLREVLRSNYGERPDHMVKQCLAEIDRFGNGRASDDVTLTIISRRIDG